MKKNIQASIDRQKVNYEQIFGVPSDILRAIFNELRRAEEKFPEWPTDMIQAAAIVNEESGELARAALKWTYEGGNIIETQKEATQVAVSAIRFLKGLQKGHYQPNPTFKAI